MPVQYLMMDGRIVPFEDAKLHILTPTVRYGASVFEGIKAYWNAHEDQLYLFRCHEHMVRLLQSARLMGMESIPYTADDLTRLVVELLQANEAREDVHIRPNLFVVGDGPMQARGPVSLGIGFQAMKHWAAKPMRLAISSWRRITDNTIPPRIKCAANYHNGRLALIQAEDDGYDGALLLDEMGHITEEPRGTFFMVRGGVVITPPVTSEILESITRDTLIQQCRELHDLEVCEREVDRTEVYVAEEGFLCGTGYEVTPVSGVDRFTYGDGQPGLITTLIRNSYLAAVRGENNLYPEWRLPVYQ